VRDKRIVIIKDLGLRKIRNELRMVLIQASNTEWDKIFNKMEEFRYDKDENRISLDDWTPSQLKQFRELQYLKNGNEEICRKSICMCYTCGKPDQDMYYNHPYRAWFCVECANLAKSHQTRIKAKKAHGIYNCDSDEEFSHSFRVI